MFILEISQGSEYEIELTVSDECSTTSLTIQINDLKIQETVSNNFVYPNPSSGIVTYQGEHHIVQSISVYNTLGSCIYKSDNIKSNTWDFSHFSEGHYIIEFGFKNSTKKHLNWFKKN